MQHTDHENDVVDQLPAGYPLSFYLPRMTNRDIGELVWICRHSWRSAAACFWNWLQEAMSRELERRLIEYDDGPPREVEVLVLPTDSWTNREMGHVLSTVSSWSYTTTNPVLGELFDEFVTICMAVVIGRLNGATNAED